MHPPGLDGSGLTAFVQYPTLAQAFELRCLTVPTSDRSSFMELVELVRAELRVRAMCFSWLVARVCTCRSLAVPGSSISSSP